MLQWREIDLLADPCVWLERISEVTSGSRRRLSTSVVRFKLALSQRGRVGLIHVS